MQGELPKPPIQPSMLEGGAMYSPDILAAMKHMARDYIYQNVTQSDVTYFIGDPEGQKKYDDILREAEKTGEYKDPEGRIHKFSLTRTDKPGVEDLTELAFRRMEQIRELSKLPDEEEIGRSDH